MYRHKHGFGWGHGFPPHMMFHCGRAWGRPWGFGFPNRKEYAEMLEAYKKELEEMQRQVAEEIDAVAREIEDLKAKPA